MAYGLMGLWLLLAGGTVLARDVLQGSACTVPAGETRTGTLFVLCERLELHGRVEGSVIGLAVRGSVSGEIAGSVYLLGGQVALSGQVARDVHFAGLSLALRPGHRRDDEARDLLTTPQTLIGGNLLAFTLSTTQAAGGRIGGDVLAAGYELGLAGGVAGEVIFRGTGLRLAGEVGRGVWASVGDPATDGSQIETLLLPFAFDIALQPGGLVVAETARLGSPLVYSGPLPGDLPPALLAAPDSVQYTPLALAPTLEQPGTLAYMLDTFLRESSTLLAIGLMGLLFAPQVMRAPLAHLRLRPVSSLSVGMLAFILSFPVVLIVLLLTAGIPALLLLLNLPGVALAVGSVLALVNLGSISLFYFVAIFVARSLVGFALGRWIVGRLWRTRPRQYAADFLASLLIGMTLLALLTALPVVGWLFNAGALFLGLGAILSILLERGRTLREQAAAPPPVVMPSPAVVQSYELLPARGLLLSEPPARPILPPPPPPPAPPGMDNLPPGFDPRFFD
ncbi:MAG: hypothetical protein MUE40_02040 [Anaerolineae bacterium]|nr:hypothetical protein [Anaerolineae bacterium]